MDELERDRYRLRLADDGHSSEPDLSRDKYRDAIVLLHLSLSNHGLLTRWGSLQSDP